MMLSFGKLLLATAILAASPACFGQPQEPYGTNWEFAREHKYQVSVAPFTSADSWVSGTKVDFTVSAGFVARSDEEPYTGPPYWSNRSLLWMKCWINDTHIGTWEPPSSPPLGLFPKNIRFASTHFEHGSTITLKVRGKFKFWNTEPAEEFENEIETTVAVKAYNKLMAWASDEASIFFICRLTCASAKSNLATSSDPFHTLVGGTHPTYYLEKSTILSHLNSATFIHMDTHGDEDSVESSKANPVETITWSEIASAVTTDRGTKPLPNIVVSYACETLRNTYPAAEAFKVRNPGAQGMIENRAIAGFNDVIYAGPIAYNYSRTDLHAAKIYEMLKMTHTLEEAVEMADDLYPIHYEPYDSNPNADNTDAIAPMNIHGDTKSTISGVYDGQETPEEQTRPWYKVIS